MIRSKSDLDEQYANALCIIDALQKEKEAEKARADRLEKDLDERADADMANYALHAKLAAEKAARIKAESALKEAENRSDRLARELVCHREKAGDNYWAWQGDGRDCLETLACPVLISADDLRSIVSQKNKAEAACVEMRDALEKARKFVPALNAGIGNYKATHKVIDHALSSDCGTGWLSPEVAQHLRGFLQWLVQPTKCDPIYLAAAFEHAQKMGKEALALLDGKQ